jgi:hypothetical protein
MYDNIVIATKKAAPLDFPLGFGRPAAYPRKRYQP